MLAQAVEELRGLAAILIAVNSTEGGTPEVKPVSRPVSVFNRIMAEVRLTRHSSLAARLLRNSKPEGED